MAQFEKPDFDLTDYLEWDDEEKRMRIVADAPVDIQEQIEEMYSIIERSDGRRQAITLTDEELQAIEETEDGEGDA